MKINITKITRFIVYLMGVALLIFLFILVPELLREEAAGRVNPPNPYPPYIGVWILSVPIFIALRQTLKLLGYIDTGKAFSKLSLKALKNIKYCLIAFGSLIFLTGTALIATAKSIDPTEDVAPVVTIGFTFIFVTAVVATFVSVLQKLLGSAIDIKEENDLTV